MTAAELAELARLEAAAEPAPWEINCSLIQFDDADRSLVVAARNALPALLQKIQSQEAELDAQEVDLDAKHAKLVAARERESRLREALFKALADDEEMRGEGHHGLDCPNNLATPNACRAIPCWVEEARQIRAALTAEEK